MKITTMDAALGAEITDLDLTTLTSTEFERIKETLLQRGVVVVRGQTLSPTQYVEFARRFGDIEQYDHLSEFFLPGNPEIIVLSNIVKEGRKIGVGEGGQYWHTDRSYVAKPAWLSVLHAITVPHDQSGKPLGETHFASMTAALSALPEPERGRAETLSAWHQYVYRFTQRDQKMEGISHPIALQHPLTGEKCLYVNKGFTHRVVGLDDTESADLLESLYAHAVKEEFVYRHQWKVGDVLFWDNYSTQHCAIGNYGPDTPRLMWRTTVQGFPLAPNAR
jgi:taurine dioxygenase